MRRLALVALLGVTSLMTAALWLTSRPLVPEGSGLRARILSCSTEGTLEGFERDGLLEGSRTEACLEELLLAEIKEGRIEPLDVVLADLSEESLGFSQFCHTVLHAVGFELGAGDDFPARLAETGNATCIYGYGHGVLEGFASVNPDPSDDVFRRAVDGCETLATRASSPNAPGLCADGLGHAAWNSTGDIDRSAVLCDLLATPTLRRVCAGGVIMQIFAPVTEAGSSLEQKDARQRDAVARLAGICTGWAGSDDGREGCDAGAGYVYSRPAHVYAALMFRAPQTEKPGLRLRAADAMQEALDLCAGHGAGEAYCADEIKRQIPPAAYVDVDLNERFCRVITPDGSGCPLRRP